MTDQTFELDVVLERNPNLTRMDRVRKRKGEAGGDTYYTVVKFENAPGQTFKVYTATKTGAAVMRAWPMRKQTRARGDAEVNGRIKDAPAVPAKMIKAPDVGPPPDNEDLAPPKPALPQLASALLDYLMQAHAVERSFMMTTGEPLTDNVRRMGITLMMEERRHGS